MGVLELVELEVDDEFELFLSSQWADNVFILENIDFETEEEICRAHCGNGEAVWDIVVFVFGYQQR